MKFSQLINHQIPEHCEIVIENKLFKYGEYHTSDIDLFIDIIFQDENFTKDVIYKILKDSNIYIK